MARFKRAIFFMLLLGFFAFPYLGLLVFNPLESNIVSFFSLMAFASLTYWIICVENVFQWFTITPAFPQAFLNTKKIFLLGISLRICLIPLTPCDDIYRYLWEGKLWWEGFNPYRVAPNSLSLAPLRDQFWPTINHPHMTTLYPPVTQLLFALAAKIGYSIFCFKLVFIGFDIGTYYVIKKILRNMHVTGEASLVATSRLEALYFLNPLLILEIAGRGHFDSVMIFLNTLFLWTLTLPAKPKALAPNFLIRVLTQASPPLFILLGGLSKITSLILFPVYILNSSLKKSIIWSFLVGAAILSVLFKSGMLGILGKFTNDFHYNEIVPYIFELAIPFLSAPTKKLLLAALFIFACGALFLWLRGKKPEVQCLYFMGLFLLFTPTLHTWYILWILPFAAITLSRPWLLMCLTVLITYLVYGRMEVIGEWKEIPWLRYPEFIPPLGLWLYLKFKTKIQS